MHFAAFKKHIGFYPTPSAIENFKNELSSYDGAKGYFIQVERGGMKGLARQIGQAVLVAFYMAGWPSSSLGQNAESLTLEIGCTVNTDASVDLIATIANVGGEHAAVLIGLRLGNGRSYLASALTIEAFSNPSTQPQEFEFLIGWIAGRVDPWIVPMPAGAAYTFNVGMKDFISREQHTLLSDADFPVEVVLRLKAPPIQDVAFGEGFVGVLTSSRLRVPDRCSFGDALEQG